jgi:pimeloyl-ACP methyl ester carboxylesterase
MAVSYFMREGMGAPRIFVNLMSMARPIWKTLKAVAHTLPYDYAVMGDTVTGKPLAAEPWGSITAPTLVVDGAKSPAPLQRAADEIAARLPDSRRCTLDRQSHNVSMKVLAPVIEKFLVEPG